MGFSVKFNWVLQITPPKSLQLNHCYSFEKQGNRIFPLNTSIDLIDLDRTAIAKIKIISVGNTKTKTTGEFQIVKIYTGDEKALLTNYWIENE